jgi:hypothetical protein
LPVPLPIPVEKVGLPSPREPPPADIALSRTVADRWQDDDRLSAPHDRSGHPNASYRVDAGGISGAG